MCHLAKTESNKATFSNLYPGEGFFLRVTYKSQNINPMSPTHKFTLGIIQITVKSLSTSFQCLIQYKRKIICTILISEGLDGGSGIHYSLTI